MSKAKKKANWYLFDAYYMDMLYGPDGWQENNRIPIGKVTVKAESFDSLDERKILKAMTEFKVKTLFGGQAAAIGTTDRRRVFAEDLYGDGTWWEVGVVRRHEPMYGLKYRGATVAE